MATVLFPFDMSIPTEFILIPPNIFVGIGNALFSMLIQSPGLREHTGKRRDYLRKSNSAVERAND
jgi:hypothetical protein